jgi:hypothetical protein
MMIKMVLTRADDITRHRHGPQAAAQGKRVEPHSPVGQQRRLRRSITHETAVEPKKDLKDPGTYSVLTVQVLTVQQNVRWNASNGLTMFDWV